MSYQSLPELIDQVEAFIAQGIANGDLVLSICDDHETADIRSALSERGAAYRTALGTGQLTIMSSRDAFFQSGSFNVESSLDAFAKALKQAVQSGYPRIRAICEMTYLLAEVPGIERAGEFESRANEELVTVYPFLCACPMNLRRDSDGTWSSILRSHPTLSADGRIFPNPHFAAAGKA